MPTASPRWVRVGTETFRLDRALRFHEEVDKQGRLTGKVLVILGNRDSFTVGKESADALRRFIAEELKPTALDSTGPRYTGGSPGVHEPGADLPG